MYFIHRSFYLLPSIFLHPPLDRPLLFLEILLTGLWWNKTRNFSWAAAAAASSVRALFTLSHLGSTFYFPPPLLSRLSPHIFFYDISSLFLLLPSSPGPLTCQTGCVCVLCWAGLCHCTWHPTAEDSGRGHISSSCVHVLVLFLPLGKSAGISGDTE